MFKLNKSMWMAYNKHVCMHIPVLRTLAKLNIRMDKRFPRYCTFAYAFSTVYEMMWLVSVYNKYQQRKQTQQELTVQQ